MSKIFGIGLSKTGTTSLYAALHYLGYQAGTYRHMSRLGMHEWFRGDFTIDYLRDYNAVTDLPLASFYKNLYKRYPDSKFILTVRPLYDWLKSCEKQLSIPPKNDFSSKGRLAIYGCELYNEKLFSQAYEKHLMEVFDFFSDKPDSLLVLNVFIGEGWEKLCPFLGKKIPNYQYPDVKPGFKAHQNPPELITIQNKKVDSLRYLVKLFLEDLFKVK